MTVVRRTFAMPNARSNPPESGAWFFIDFASDGAIIGIEEHDSYAGGPVLPLGGETYETLVERCVKNRAKPGLQEREFERFVAWRAAEA